MLKHFPIFLNLKDKKILIVGGGRVALEKLISFKNTGANITIIAIELCKEILDYKMYYTETLNIIQREIKTEDIENLTLLILATNNHELNGHLLNYAMSKHILVNSVDDPIHCDFYSASILDKNFIRIAISSDGKFPGVTSTIKKLLDIILPDEHNEEWNKILMLRERIKSEIPDIQKRNEILRKLVKNIEAEYFQIQ